MDTAIRFDSASDYKLLFVTLVNSDLTEGRGHSVIHSVHLSEDAAEAAAYGSDVMGSDGTTVSAPFAIGVPNRPIFVGDRTKTLFGYVAGRKNYNGPRYTRLANIPNFDDEQWAEFTRLSHAAGRNPMVDDDRLRRERVLARKDVLRSAEHGSAPLYAVVVDDTRQGTHRSSLPLIVAVLDTDGDEEEAADLFVAVLNQHPELSTHRVVELFVGREGDEMFGKTIDLPKSNEMTARLLGANADGTVFIVPGETEEYILRGGVLYTSDGYEADLVGLAAQGLRVRTDADVADIAYQKMQRMLSKASRG